MKGLAIFFNVACSFSAFQGDFFMYILDDTIAAISTPPGEGGIAIIRISGEDAISVADRVYYSKHGKMLSDVASNTINYGFVRDNDGNIVDEVLVSVMRAPHTYTGEDVVEINCHGGFVSTRKILSLVLGAGAVQAGAGEFTKRAFLNGRIDLSQAESVIDIINSKTNLDHNIAVNQLGGKLSEEINSLREKLLSLLSHIQVLIDYPDEDLEPMSEEEFAGVLTDVLSETKSLLATSDCGKIARNGISTAIVGKPNVGKSSLLNLLSGEERAIVTDIEGTTRDAIEETINLSDVVLKIADTAGIRDTEDVIENIGVSKSKKYLEDADLVLFVLDGKRPLDENDRYIMENIKGKNAIAIINKTENGCVIDADEIKNFCPRTIMFSVHENLGTKELTDTITELFDMGKIKNNSGSVIANARHKDALIKAEKNIQSAIDALSQGVPQDMVSVDIESAISNLGEIVGLTVGEEVVDKIFHNFCIGK